MTEFTRPDGSSGLVPTAPTVAGGQPLAPDGGIDTAVGMDPGVDDTAAAGLELKVRSQWSYARMRFFRHRLAVAGLVGLIIIFGAGIFANFVAPYSYAAIDLNNILHPPTTVDKHYFGTDGIGADEFSRVIYGIRTSLEVGVFVAVVSSIFGLIVGAVAGYFGGLLDNLLMRITDLVLTLPALAILLAVTALLGGGEPVDHLHHPRRLLLDGHRPRRARSLPLPAREGVRRGREGVGSRRRSDHVPAHPPEHARPGHRQRHAGRGNGDPDGGCALLPRLRHPAADRVTRGTRRQRRRTIPCSGG